MSRNCFIFLEAEEDLALLSTFCGKAMMSCHMVQYPSYIGILKPMGQGVENVITDPKKGVKRQVTPDPNGGVNS